jgi:adenylate cyclase
VFGAPVALADHASRALAAARGMRLALAAFNAGRKSPVKMGIGIHSGPVVTGCLGGAAKLEFTVLGDTVNTASRLEGMTKEKAVDVLVSEETAKRAGQAGLTPLGEVHLRGREAMLAVYSLDPPGAR